MMGYSIEPSESLPPIPMVESDRKEDIVVDVSTFRSWRKKKGKPKARKQARKQEDNKQ